MADNIYGDKFDSVSRYAHEPITVESDPRDALRELVDAVNALRAQVSASDREIIDASMNTIGTDAEPRSLRQALGQLAGVAVMVGQDGTPVIAAVRKLMGALDK